MSSDDAGPTPELDTLFESERGHEQILPAAARARLLAGVRKRIVPPDGGGGSGGDGGAPGGASMATTRAVAGMIATFIAGGVIGAAAMRPAPPTLGIAGTLPTTHTLPSPPSAASTPLAGDNLDRDLAQPASAAAVSAAAAPAPRPSPAATEDARGAAAERALLDAARIALASNEADRALEAVERHARDYPYGRLAEEREAIAVRALVKGGRYDEARTRGARFQLLYPRSVAAPAVSAAIRSIP